MVKDSHNYYFILVVFLIKCQNWVKAVPNYQNCALGPVPYTKTITIQSYRQASGKSMDLNLLAIVKDKLAIRMSFKHSDVQVGVYSQAFIVELLAK